MNGSTTPVRETRDSSSEFLRLFLGIAFATALALSPLPVFAQHGGGGGGHAGGGGGGHASGGGGHASGGGSRGGAAPAGYGGGNSTGGSRGGTSTTGSGTYVSGGRPSTSSSRYVGGNNTWQAPPSVGSRYSGPAQHFVSSDEAAASGARVMGAQAEPQGIRGPFSPSTAMRGTFVGARASALPPHIPPFPPRRSQPIFFYGGAGCFSGFFPGFCGGGFFGGGLFFGYGYGWGCDPYWGCPAGYSSGYYNGGGSYGNAIYNDSGDDGAISNEFNPSRYANPPEAGNSESSGSYASSAPEMVLYLKDGTVYALDDYWVADGKLHYVTNYGGENSVDLDTIDMQRTVDVNAKRGINVTLRPAPMPQDQNQPQTAPNAPATTPQQ